MVFWAKVDPGETIAKEGRAPGARKSVRPLAGHFRSCISDQPAASETGRPGADGKSQAGSSGAPAPESLWCSDRGHRYSTNTRAPSRQDMPSSVACDPSRSEP